MKNARLFSTVAATLLLAAGAASAQDIKKDEAPARAPAAQQNAPAEKIAPAMKAGERKVPETSGQAIPAEGNRATTGQGSAAGSAKMTAEQRSKIAAIFKQQKVEPAQLHVAVSVGTRVPESVHVNPVPVAIITAYPEWGGFDYILVGHQIAIIDPLTHEIVALLEV